MLIILIVLVSCGHESQAGYVQYASHWPDGKIFYNVSPDMPQHIVKAIKYSIQYLNNLTCVKWVQRYPFDVDVVNYVSFQYWYNEGKRPRCNATHEMQGGQQQIDLGPKCMNGSAVEKRSIILHEMFHVMGFYHEHQRNVRDCYIEVVPPWLVREVQDLQINYNIFSDWPYDYNSIMHWVSHLKAWEKNQTVGRQDDKVSEYDIDRMDQLYCTRIGSYCNKGPQFKKMCDDRAEKLERKKNNPHCTQRD